MAFKSCTFKISWIQLLQVYKTNAKYFVVGSNNAETRFKIIKISRTDPKELAIEEDHAEYTLPEIKDIIERLHAGNMGKSKSSWKNRGLVQTLTAFGIIGFVRFMEGYYMILVTKRSVAAEVGGHRLYKIEDTSMIYIPNNSVRVAHPEESRYLKSFQMVDLSSNFYYSYSYDLTNTLQLNVTFQYLCACAAAGPSGNNDHETEKSSGQRNMDDNGIDLSDRQSKSILCLNPTINERYLWNRFLKQPIENPEISANWTINVIHGFLGQRKINVYGAPIYVTLIARRSCAYAGTRFLKRGCNICGDSANEVETEQMVHSATLTSFLQGQYTAYVQHRASVPVFWFQDITSSVVPAKPPITLACADPYCQATGKHFSQLFERYGSPIVVLNLVKKHGRRSNESQLGKSFKEAIEYLNLFLPMKHRIIYRSLDMAHLLHSMKSDVIMRLDQIAKENLQYTGIFQSNAKLFQRSLKADSMWNSLGGRQFGPFRLQTGVVRSNCVDCLDRTNSAQFIAAKCAFVCQVFSLGILPYPEIDFDADAIRLFEDLFEEHGDIIALQYGGSQLVHTIESYRQTAVLATHSRDIVTTLSRYHSNTFSDTYKQSAINLFLGVYQPGGQHCPQWDMVTDNYLHNAEIDILESFSTGGYTMWLEHRLRSTLPLPAQLAVALQLARQLSSYVAQSSLLPSTNQEVDWYEEFYRTSELTSFADLHGMTIAESLRPSSTNGPGNISPFARRSEKWRELKNHKVSDNMSSRSSIDQSSSSDEEQTLEVRYIADEGIDVVQAGSLLQNSETTSPVYVDEFSPVTVYGEKIAWQPSRQDLNVYHRYIAVDDILNKFIPVSAFTQDSSRHVEPPTVDKYSRQAYERSVSNASQYPATSLSSFKVYKEYVGAISSEQYHLAA